MNREMASLPLTSSNNYSGNHYPSPTKTINLSSGFQTAWYGYWIRWEIIKKERKSLKRYLK